MSDTSAAPVTLAAAVYEALVADCRLEPGLERCGLVGGVRGCGVTLYPVANVAEDPTSAFLLDARGQIDAMRRMRETGEDLYAIYHSHPASPPAPSARDLAAAAYRGTGYLIVSFAKGPPEVAAYRYAGSAFTACRLEVVRAGDGHG